MAPSTTVLFNNTSFTTLAPTKQFYQMGLFLGIEIFYVIIGAAALICILCCLVLICCKCRKRNSKNIKKLKSNEIEMSNGMELNWKYTIKGQSIDTSKYRSSLANKNIANNSNNHHDEKAFDRIINDRKTTVTHNPLGSVSPATHKNEHPVAFSNTNTQNTLGLQNNNTLNTVTTMSYNNGHSNGYAQSMSNNNAHLYGNDNSNHFKKHQNNHSSSSEEYETDSEESDNNTTHLNIHSNTHNVQVVDTLTSIVNQANNKQKQMTHVLSLNKLDMNIMAPTSSCGDSSVGFNREPSVPITSAASSQLTLKNRV